VPVTVGEIRFVAHLLCLAAQPRDQCEPQNVLLHVHSLFDMLDLVVNSLGPDLEPLADELVELGKRHRGRGVRPDHLRVMDRAFVDGIGALLGDRCTQDDRDAWREIFRFLIEHMSAGME
jgi:hypothetical protein